MKEIFSALAFTMALASPAFALQAQTTTSAASKPGSAAVTQSTRVTAQITAIDPATRTITLKQPNGHTSSFEAGEEVRNFDQLKVGDTVTTEYLQEITLSLVKEGGAKRGQAQQEGMTRSAPGARPGGTARREVTVVADVESVNTQDKVVTLRGPEGNVVDLKIEDPEQLKRIKKGDHIKAVYTEALAIKVEPAK